MNQADFLAVIAGQRNDWTARLLRAVLHLPAWGYGWGMRGRNCAYSRQWLKSSRAPIPVISIGNLTTGGTGKTPWAAYIARWFRNAGIRVCFISRGYAAQPGMQNDEALVLEQLCPDVPHLQHPDRVASAQIAVEELDSQLLILDDGFQHRRLARDLDLVLIDALEPWGHDALLPRGLLREPVSSLRRADLAVLTRVDQADPLAVKNIRARIARLAPALPCVEVAFVPQGLRNGEGGGQPLDSLRGQTVRAFCGIGNPAAFRQTVLSLGANLPPENFRVYADHHPYSREDISSLREWADGDSAVPLLTTQKDLVKIPLTHCGSAPLWSIELGCTLLSGAAELEAALRKIAAAISRENSIAR